jgi:trans-2,3-dihydro-3-hydroxyanthranilate isomerase
MGISRYRYLHYDVFTDRRFEGNQLAVFPDAAGLSAETMQRVAREMGFAETTFVTAAQDAASDVRMRIFTPATEMPMAGHPVIGSTFALARVERIAPAQDRFVFGLNIGPLPVELQWHDTALKFAWMSQPLPEFGAVFDVPEIAAAIAVPAAAIRATGLPIQQVSCGVPFVMVPIDTRASVDAAIPDVHALRFPVYLFTTDRGNDTATVYSRMFAPSLGVYEDPATGSASGPLGCYLVRHSVISPARSGAILNLQGVRLGRPSWIHIDIGSSGDNISRVRVGGTSVFVAEGVMDVED